MPDRSSRAIGVTAEGEQLLGYGRRMIAMNDDIFSQMTGQAYERALVLGVPHDTIYPGIPWILQFFLRRVSADETSGVVVLDASFEGAFCGRAALYFPCQRRSRRSQWRDFGDLANGVVWGTVGVGVGVVVAAFALASEPHCEFRASMMTALDRAGLPWEMALDSESTRTVEAVVAADLAVFAQIKGTNAPRLEDISHGGHRQKWARNQSICMSQTWLRAR